ncbi:type II toxin-antitoxin system Phd/YefM family antitoxin [Natranaerofaba carboxydovora]|uniref:type II toxin-antitoxin system Phd/YefM family antitoxin n=1 Tax=Natranaerofaba carboxydovora TaxID=2742683 RepID=UPI001F135E19|nr:type II toxin-antitoxin system prevent-host-death family antitoxin [Natranaerofaba carboxydovora]UMZ74727.1 Antitoxin Phd_YefM, type II toxin-antitoxin system [Natranaerofaba carboxydovora]
MDIGVREAKNKLSKYLKQVKQGETIVITEHGIPIARIVPYEEQVPKEIVELQKTGMATWQGDKPKGMKTPVKLKSKNISKASDIVSEDRR